MQGEDDAALVSAARDGDRQALATLLTRHRPLLLALCLRMVKDRDLADDAAQEAALQAMLNLDRLRRPERFGSWLAGIGLNVCRRMLRQIRSDWSWEAVVGGRWGPAPIDVEPDPAEVAAAADLAAQVRGAVAELPRGQRAAVALFYLAGLTHVVDPVMVAKSGDHLLHPSAVSALRTLLLPLALVVTPNIREASVLADRPVETDSEPTDRC